MSKKTELPMRLAFRAEGEWWNVYLAAPNTMDDARKVGSILMVAVRDNPERKQAFMDLMQGFLGEVIKGVVGTDPIFKSRDAPPNERAGNA